MKTISTPQYTAALALAAAHSHQWGAACSTWTDGNRHQNPEDPETYAAECMWLDGEIASGTISIETIEKLSRALGYGPCGGIGAPDLCDDGHVRHTTGSGRLSWDVAPDGTVRLEVSRPHPDLAAARKATQATAGGFVEGGPWATWEDYLAACQAADAAYEAAKDLPPRVVLRAVARPNKSAIVERVDGAEARHVETIEGALRAVAGDDAAESACADAWRGVPDLAEMIALWEQQAAENAGQPIGETSRRHADRLRSLSAGT